MAKMVSVRMLKDMPSRKLLAGKVAELPAVLARIFVKRGQAAEIGASAIEQAKALAAEEMKPDATPGEAPESSEELGSVSTKPHKRRKR